MELGRRRTPMAPWALALSLCGLLGAPLIFLVAAFDGGGDAFEEEDAALPPWFMLIFGLSQILTLGGPIAGVALGVAVRGDPRAAQSSRNLALAAVVIGGVFLGLHVLSMILMVIIIVACLAACGQFANTTVAAVGGAPCGTLALGAWPGRLRQGEALAHHPELPEFREDVYHVGGHRFCVGCFTAYPLFAIVLAWAFFAQVPMAWAAIAGAPLVAVQAISMLGLTATRASKAVVKACAGGGAALATHAILASGWPELVQSLLLVGGAAMIVWSSRPRLARIRAIANRAKRDYPA